MKTTSSQDTLLGQFRTAGLWLALGLAWAPASLPAAAPAKPNVLFIITDQQFAEVMSCRMGKQYINTPAMDSLAARGMLFTRAYSSNPLCGPWRNSVFTGRYYEPGFMGGKTVHLDDGARRFRIPAHEDYTP